MLFWNYGGYIHHVHDRITEFISYTAEGDGCIHEHQGFCSFSSLYELTLHSSLGNDKLNWRQSYSLMSQSYKLRSNASARIAVMKERGWWLLEWMIGSNSKKIIAVMKVKQSLWYQLPFYNVLCLRLTIQGCGVYCSVCKY